MAYNPMDYEGYKFDPNVDIFGQAYGGQGARQVVGYPMTGAPAIPPVSLNEDNTFIAPTGTKSGSTDDDVWSKYINAMTKTMNTQKEKDISKLDANLASRGLSRSGNLPAGVTDIAGSYANALENFLAQTALEKAKLDATKPPETPESVAPWSNLLNIPTR